MKNNPLDDIIQCDIDISNPASSDEAFNNILLVVESPSSAGTQTMSTTTAVSRAADLLDYGFTETDSAYLAASIAFSQSPSPRQLYVCIREQTGDGDSAEYETISAALDRANGEVDFYGIHLTSFKDADDVTGAVEWAESHDKLFGCEYADMESCPVSDFSYYRSFGIFSGSADGYGAEEQPEENQYAALALMAKCFGYDPGSETWHLKELKGIIPSALSQTDKDNLAETNINTFLRYAGSNVTIGGYTLAGEWIDVIRFRDWLKLNMQENVFRIMKNNIKVPFLDAGIGLIEGAMEATLANGQVIGGIAPTQYDSDYNEIPGYTVTVPRAADLTEEERKARKLTGCRYTARLAGAIHLVEISGTLTF